MTDAATHYHSRFRRVLDYIDTNADRAPSIDELSDVAAFSRFHFHRQFAALFDINVVRYMHLLRMKRAAWQLAFRNEQVIEIALQGGYDNPESFSRAFRHLFGQSPSEFRKQPHWSVWQKIFAPLHQMRSIHMTTERQLDQVRIVTVPHTRVAVLAHRGDPQSLGESIRKFIAWRRANALPPSVSATYNIFHDDPTQVAPDNYRMDLCAGTQHDVEPNDYGVVAGSIPGGRCAVVTHVGSDDSLGATFDFLFGTWLPQSGEELRDFPLYLQRLTFFPDVPEHEAVVDVYLPLR